MDADKEPRETNANLNRGGRPKGSPNKFTAHAKEAFQLAFEELGGVRGLVAWAKSDEARLTDFYKLFARLIPLEVTGKDGKDLVPAVSPTEFCREMLFELELAQREAPRPATTQH